jgi:hypothetical protein
MAGVATSVAAWLVSDREQQGNAMTEPKPLASLSSSLLARKGDARPAIRRSHLPLLPLSGLSQADVQNAPGCTTKEENPISPARQQRDRIERRYSAGQKAPPRKPKAAFTLRLDADRHLRLRIASAIGNRSAQQIVTEALDAFLDKHPRLDILFDKARTASEK